MVEWTGLDWTGLEWHNQRPTKVSWFRYSHTLFFFFFFLHSEIRTAETDAAAQNLTNRCHKLLRLVIQSVDRLGLNYNIIMIIMDFKLCQVRPHSLLSSSGTSDNLSSIIIYH